MSWLVPRPKGDTIRCEKFGGLIEKYGEKILSAVNDEVRRINLQVKGSSLQAYLTQLHAQYQGIKSGRDTPYKLVVHFPHNFIHDRKQGYYSSFAELVAVALEVCHMTDSSYITNIYSRLVGQTDNAFQEVALLLQELGVTVIDCRLADMFTIDQHQHVDFADYDFDNTNGNAKVNYTKEIAPIYAEYLKEHPEEFYYPDQTSRYLSNIHNNLSKILHAYRDRLNDLSIIETIKHLQDQGMIGSSFYILVAVRLVKHVQQRIQVASVHGLSHLLGVELPVDPPIEGGHANMIQITLQKDHLELYMYEPHGQSRYAKDLWYGIPQKFLELLAIHLKHSHGITCVVSPSFCPRVQGELPFCAMYSIYFYIVEHLNQELTSKERKHMIEWMCSGSRDRGPDQTRSQYMSKGNANSVQRLTPMQKKGWLTHVDALCFPDMHNDTCSIDTIILMLVAFYGISNQKLYPEERMETGYRPRIYNSRAPGARSPASSAHSSMASKSGLRPVAPSTRAHNARHRG